VLTELCKAGALEIEMDLRRVTLVGSSGVDAISNAKKLCAEHRSAFFVLPRDDQIPLLERGGLLDRGSQLRHTGDPPAE
jgi:hypothetical protein